MAPYLAPLPSFVRASAQDAGNMSMRKACRSAWSEGDADVAAATLDRLVRSIYGRPSDHNQPDYCFIRFQIAERMERRGEFKSTSDLAEINRKIDELCTA